LKGLFERNGLKGVFWSDLDWEEIEKEGGKKQRRLERVPDPDGFVLDENGIGTIRPDGSWFEIGKGVLDLDAGVVGYSDTGYFEFPYWEYSKGRTRGRS